MTARAELIRAEPSKGPPEQFTGDVWVDMIAAGELPSRLRVGVVRFCPGARTAWHRHALGQTLHVTEGVGLVQSRSGDVTVMHPGDTVHTPPGQWHWHGAVPDRFMTHLAIAESPADPAAPGVEWGEHVTGDDYRAAAHAYAESANTHAAAGLAAHPTTATDIPAADPLIIHRQGSFAVGGTVITNPGTFDPRNPTDPAGQTLHGDHARISYQIPAHPRRLPLLLWHGWWENGNCWDTTPDGREGFKTIFLRRGFPVYLLDQPRRGSAGKTTVAAPAATAPNEQWFFNQFRLGLWPDLYDGVQFSSDPQALEQFFRAMVPDTGPIDTDVLVDAVSAAVDRIGPTILVTHSHAGGFGWLTQMRNAAVRAVVSLEPGSGFVFPDGEVPPAMASSNGTLEGVCVPAEQFRALTQVPIIVYYGDNIPAEPTDIAGRDNWRVRRDMARLWVDAINRHSGDAEFVSLPDIGITGNTHFAFSDLNNVEIADQISAFLSRKGLD